jgi:hypothetical protein
MRYPRSGCSSWSSPGAEDVQYEAIEVVAYRLRKKLAHAA